MFTATTAVPYSHNSFNLAWLDFSTKTIFQGSVIEYETYFLDTLGLLFPPMDNPWSAKDWKPTVDAESVACKRSNLLVRKLTALGPHVTGHQRILIFAQEVQLFQIDLQELTQHLLRCPYDPVAWLQRAEVLLPLGFPELAVGDAYKALLLIGKSRKSQHRLAACIDHHLGINSSTSAKNSEAQRSVTERSSLLALIQGLLFANCLQESLEYAERAVAKYPESTNLRSLLITAQHAHDRDQWESMTDENIEGMTPLEEDEYRRSGHVLLQSYPWMDTELFARGAEVTASGQRQFLRASWSLCSLERSSVREGMPLGDRSERFAEVFGVMATEDLGQNEMLLVDHTSASAVDDPADRCLCCCGKLTANFITLECCSTRYCSKLCVDLALATYHLAVCGKDLSRFEKACRKNLATPERAADEMLFLRVLAGAVKHSTTHPLHAPLVKQLTAMYDGKKQQPFDLKTNITSTFKMLTCLGIDIFANHNFDTWVLQTLRARIGNNAREYSVNGHAHIAINPLHSFFNHSCDPNVKWEDDKATHSSTIRMYTLRRVSEGEELFISYQDELSDKPYLERRKVLREWLGFDCQCTKCKDEQAADRSKQ